MSEEDQNPKRRILVLGCPLDTELVKSFGWTYLPPDLNVADYDTVVLDFTAFQVPAIARAFNIDVWPSFRHFARLLFSEDSEIVVIGRPFFQIGSNPYLESTWFLPIAPAFLDEAGDSLTLVDPRYAGYFDHVTSWSFCLAGWRQPNPPFIDAFMAEAGIPTAVHISPRVESIADNRYGRPVAFTFHYMILSDREDELGESGSVTWLPPTKDLSPSEAISILLRSRFGVLEKHASPTWLSEITLPAELPIRGRIAEIETQAGALADELRSLEADLVRAERPKGVLFETGEDVLEPLVREALQALGAFIELPAAKGKEDARLTDPTGRLGTVEIKGRAGPLRLSDVRQMQQWVADRIVYENCQSKGILVANLNKDQPPSARAQVFPPNCLDAAHNLGIALVTTSQLIAALISLQHNTLNLTDFWDAVFSANGEAAVPTL